MTTIQTDAYRLRQRRGSGVAHAVRVVEGRLPSDGTLCGQWAPGHSSWTVQPGEVPLCKRCARYMDVEATR